MPRAGQAFDRRVCYRRGTSALSLAKAAALVPVDQPPRALSATLRAVSAIASQGPQGPSAASVPLATGGTQRRAAGVSTRVWPGWAEGRASLDPYRQLIYLPFLSQAASVHKATVTHTRAAAPVPPGSVGSGATPAASSTRCLCQAGPGTMAYTVKVRPRCALPVPSVLLVCRGCSGLFCHNMVFLPCLK